MQVTAAAVEFQREPPPLSFMTCRLSPIIKTAVTMKKFNLKKALAGDEVITRAGWPVKLTGVNVGVEYVLNGVLSIPSGFLRVTWTLEGKYMSDEKSDFDLFML